MDKNTNINCGGLTENRLFFDFDAAQKEELSLTLERCVACPKKCRANRHNGVGFCGASDKIFVSRVAIHQWEEPSISGENGSGTIFFTGCNLRCVFCQNKVISSSKNAFATAREFAHNDLIEAILKLQALGAHNINLVTPTHYLPQIVKVLREVKPKLQIPIVYNSSGYESVASLKLLRGLVDVYLPDFKYFSSELSAKYSGVADYFEVASEAISEMFNQVGKCIFNKSGVIQKGMIVRHLALPSCRGDSIEVVKHLARLLPVDQIKLSLMRQFTPDFVDKEKYPELCRRLTTFEYNSVVSVAASLGFDGYIQGADSAVSSYTPDFNTREAYI